MAGTPIDAAELRLLSNIIALVLDEQPGQAVAALEALRRRAATGRISGGALKNLFERMTSEEAAGTTRADAQRLQLDLDAALVQASRLSAENAALQRRLAQAERGLMRFATQAEHRRPSAALHFTPAPRPRHAAGLLAGMLITLLALSLQYDHESGATARHARPATAANLPRPPERPAPAQSTPRPNVSTGAAFSGVNWPPPIGPHPPPRPNLPPP